MRKTIYNDDSQGVSETRPCSAKADLEAWVDKPLTRLNIDTYVWCIAFPDICMHLTQAGEIYGQRFAEPPNPAAATIAKLHAEGTDVLHVVAQRAKRHGVEFIAGVRMNDAHGLYPDPDDPQISLFLMQHPEWVIHRDDGVPERALDYSIPEVRQHRLAILRELAENYDIDGIELDFTRWAKFFRRSQAPVLAPLMSEFVGQVRQMLDEVAKDRSRAPFVLGVQVLESLYLNLLAGLEPKRWVAGIIFIPPHLAQECCIRAERTQLRETFQFQRIHEGVYNSHQMDTKWSEEIEEDYREWRKTNTPEQFQHLEFEEDQKSADDQETSDEAGTLL